MAKEGNINKQGRRKTAQTLLKNSGAFSKVSGIFWSVEHSGTFGKHLEHIRNLWNFLDKFWNFLENSQASIEILLEHSKNLWIILENG